MPRAGGALFSWVARVDGQVAGLLATIPVRLTVFGTEIDANRGSDVLVAPEQQGHAARGESCRLRGETPPA